MSNTDMKGEVLAVHRGDGNTDDLFRYPKKTDECKSDVFRDGDDTHTTTLDDMNHEESREEVGSLRRNENGQGQLVVESETRHESPKQNEQPLVRVKRDEEEQAVLERDSEESISGSPEREDNDPNTPGREIEQLDTQLANGHLEVDGTQEDKGRDENRVLGKEGEYNSRLMLMAKDDELQSLICETQTDNTTVRKMETSQVAGEQDSPSCTPDAVIAAGEAIQNVYFNGPVLPQSPSLAHKHPQSEIETPGHRRTNSFQRLKTQMHKAWRGVSNLRDDHRPTFNPEVLANQKRQWYQLHSSKALVFNLSRV